jgi:RND superfamily putative drug exporter
MIVAWLAISGVAGPMFGQLSTVQKNDNTKFLPASAESQLVSEESKKFQGATFDQFPALALFIGTVDQSKVAAANIFFAGLAEKPLVDVNGAKLVGSDGKTIDRTIGSFLIPNAKIFAFPSAKNDALLASIPISASSATETLSNKKPSLPAIVNAIRYYTNGFGKGQGWESHLTGIGAIFADLFGAFGSIDSSLLLTTGLVVSLILIVVYRSPVLWILPLFSAVTALSLAGSIIYLLAKHNIIDLDGQSQGILSVLVLGAATDYALLLIARYREELHLEQSRFVAMKKAWRGVVEPIIASGSTVTLGLLVLLLATLKNSRGLGPVGAIGIVASMITILTFLPALLVVFGRWIFWPRIPHFNSEDEKLSGIWSKIAKRTEKHPRKYWVATALLLIVFSGFTTTLHANGVSSLDQFTKKTDSIEGQRKLSNYFPGGEGSPTVVIVPQAKMLQATAALQAINGVTSVVPMTATPTGAGQGMAALKVVDGKVILNATLKYGADSLQARAMIPGIRSAMHAVDPTIITGGTSAVYFDIDAASTRDRNLIIPVVLFLIAIVLALLLRSILSVGLLLVTVVLSFLATLGVSSLVFHHIFHFAGEDSSYPLFSFIFLVALGIDYNIFLMTRVREEALKMGTRAGMTKAVTVTGGVITSAGVVLAATFTVLGILPLVALAEIGFTVGFGVLLDTLVVRSILVPALVHAIGPKIWWPSKLQHETLES